MEGAELDAGCDGCLALHGAFEDRDVSGLGGEVKFCCDARIENAGACSGIDQEAEAFERANRAADDDQVVAVELEANLASYALVA